MCPPLAKRSVDDLQPSDLVAMTVIGRHPPTHWPIESTDETYSGNGRASPSRSPKRRATIWDLDDMVPLSEERSGPTSLFQENYDKLRAVGSAAIVNNVKFTIAAQRLDAALLMYRQRMLEEFKFYQSKG